MHLTITLSSWKAFRTVNIPVFQSWNSVYSKLFKYDFELFISLSLYTVLTSTAETGSLFSFTIP